MGNGSQLFGLASELTYLNTKSFISVEKGGNYFKQEYDRYSYLKLYGILEIFEIFSYLETLYSTGYGLERKNWFEY